MGLGVWPAGPQPQALGGSAQSRTVSRHHRGVSPAAVPLPSCSKCVVFTVFLCLKRTQCHAALLPQLPATWVLGRRWDSKHPATAAPPAACGTERPTGLLKALIQG